MSLELAYWEARARALFRALDADPAIFLLGGLVSLPFNPNDGLLERYGDRVLWPPISEFATAGMAVGAAIEGLRPLVAVGTSSFMFHGWPAVVNEAPNVRYLSGGAASAPCVFHVMAGSRRHGGAQHEHTPQAMLQNVPGLRVYTPGTPAQVDAVFHEALHAQDPVVIVDHVLLGDVRGSVPEHPAKVAAELIREGDDLLIVSYSLMAQRALAAGGDLAEVGIEAAVLSVPQLAPAPVDAVVRFASEHSAVLFVDESRAGGSPASLLLSRVAEARPGKPVALLCSADAPAPFAGELLDEIVPTRERIVTAARVLVGDAP